MFLTNSGTDRIKYNILFCLWSWAALNLVCKNYKCWLLTLGLLPLAAVTSRWVTHRPLRNGWWTWNRAPQSSYIGLHSDPGSYSFPKERQKDEEPLFRVGQRLKEEAKVWLTYKYSTVVAVGHYCSSEPSEVFSRLGLQDIVWPLLWSQDGTDCASLSPERQKLKLFSWKIMEALQPPKEMSPTFHFYITECSFPAI